MPKLIFVIGATATGKTHFIKTQFSDGGYEILNVFDYQNRLFDEAGVGNFIPFQLQRKILMNSNKLILNDMIDNLSKGKNVVVEHTLFMAKRRIAYNDEIKKMPDVTIDIYVMRPSKKQWSENLKKRGLEDRADGIESESKVMEFPNPAEGFDKIYEVIDGEIKLRIETPAPEILEPARAEIQKELEEFLKKEKEEEEKKKLLESMNHRSFWHYCEVCGKKEYLTAEEAHDQGWDYPPKAGVFGLLGPRTCGECHMTDTLYWKVTASDFPIVIEKKLSPEELITWRRIKNEPNSLISEEIAEGINKDIFLNN